MPRALLAGETLGASLAELARQSGRSSATFPESREKISAAELDVAATDAAAEFHRLGVSGELVGVLVTTTPTFFVTIFGLWRAGAALSVLPAPKELGSAERIARRLAAIVRAAGIRHVVADQGHAELAERLAELVTGLQVLDAGQRPSGAHPGMLPVVGPDGLAVVQFTSGSTSAPKGVMLTHRAVLAGLLACVVSGEFSADDIFMQWVPTFHDMGLIGLLSHWLNGAQVHVFTPSAFLRRPARVLRYFGEHRGTVITGPNFSYDHLLDAVGPDQLAGLDLSSWRLAFNGAEPVNPETVRRFGQRFAEAGVSPSVMYPVYGLAEATLAVSFPRPGSAVRIVDIQRASLEADSTAVRLAGRGDSGDALKRAVSVGYPVHGMAVRIAGETAGGDTALGEIQIRGDAVTIGYYGGGSADQKLFTGDGWLRTGDLGFRLDGELFVMGRRKEMIVVHGQNFFPEDVESIVREVPGLYQKRCVAFPASDGYMERMGVIAEVGGGTATDDLRRQITRRIAGELSLSQVDVHLVEPKWLTRTTSGKWQRSLAAQRIAARRDA